MIIFVPISTDAPIYHWPFATLGLIIVNAVIYFLTCRSHCRKNAVLFGSMRHVWLQFGSWNPWQWLTANY